jgi:hypothetical protein
VIRDWCFLRALARFLAVALAFSVLGGCSLLRVGYGQLDTYAAWVADDYFDLDAQQKQEFRARFDRLHEWHRYEQLPDYAAFLSSAGARVQKGITREDVLWITDSVRARYRALILRGADDAAALLLTVTPAQLETMKQQWDKNNRRFVREHRLDQDAEAQRAAAVQRMLVRVRDWTGTLTVEQEERVAALARELPANAQLRHEDRLRRQREFLQLMAQRGDRASFTERLRRWLLDWEAGRDPEYARLWAEWPQKQATFYVAVDRLLTPQQRTHVARRLQGYADDFTRLARRPEAATASR